MRSSGKLWAARQLLMIARARRRSFREPAGSISVAPAALTWVRECSGRLWTIISAAAGSSTLTRSPDSSLQIMRGFNAGTDSAPEGLAGRLRGMAEVQLAYRSRSVWQRPSPSALGGRTPHQRLWPAT